MAPTVEDADLILADLAEPRFRQDGIYLLRHDSGLAVKRIQRRPDGKLLIRSDNPKYEAMVVPTVNVIGRVIWTGGRV
jgi:phage repressor protein C with HTH and peptisase S24 domain